MQDDLTLAELSKKLLKSLQGDLNLAELYIG